jgi:hypothetical protein
VHSSRVLSVSLLLACLNGGCLDTPANYEARTQIPPFVVASKVSPRVDSLVRLAPGADMVVYVPFRSEDLGEDVIGLVYLDSVNGITNRTPLRSPFRISASDFDDVGRAVEGTVPLRLAASEAGCHTVTLVLTQESNYFKINQELDETVAASVVWWVHVEDVNQGTVSAATLASCPGAGF